MKLVFEASVVVTIAQVLIQLKAVGRVANGECAISSGHQSVHHNAGQQCNALKGMYCGLRKWCLEGHVMRSAQVV